MFILFFILKVLVVGPVPKNKFLGLNQIFRKKRTILLTQKEVCIERNKRSLNANLTCENDVIPKTLCF